MTDGLPPRVLMIAPQTFFTMAGTPINVRFMCRALGQLGYGVDLLTLPGGQDVDEPGLRIHRAARLPVGPVPVGFSLAKVVYNPVLMAQAGWMLARGRYAAVHAVEESAFWAVPLARLYGVPAICDLDSDLPGLLLAGGSAAGRRMAGLARLLRRRALQGSAAIAAVVRPLADLARREAPGVPVFEIADIPLDGAFDAPSPDAVRDLRDQLDLTGAEVVAYTGNFDRRQGVAELVEAMALLAARRPRARLLIVGGHPAEVAAMQSHAEAKGVAELVRFAGRRPPEQMPLYMGAADVLVSPRLEPLITPLKIFTYMASGRPIVATDLPTHTRVVDGSSAFLAAPTADGLADAMERALANPAAAGERAAAACRLVREKHSFARFKQEMALLYAAATGQETPSWTPQPVNGALNG